jgi:putative transposase
MSRVQSWEVSDELWERVEPLIPKRTRDPNRQYKRKPGGGRKPLPLRQVFAGIVYVLRTGCQWKAAPKERFGSPGSIYEYFRQWLRQGFFLTLWKAGLLEYDELKGIEWEWQSIDGAMTKAPMALESVGRNPTDRGKKGTKRHILVDGRGAPLALVATGANRHDVTQTEAVLDGNIAQRPQPTEEHPQHLCADKAYDSRDARIAMEQRGYTPHVRSRGEERKEKIANPGHRARRWVVEACHSWMNRFRKILVRYEKTDASYLALVHLACAIITWRMAGVIYG